MARVLAIDYGNKRIGLAVTDEQQLIAGPLTTVPSAEIFVYLTNYLEKEKVEAIVVGMPKDLYNQDSHSSEAVRQFVAALKNKFSSYDIILHDERYTSKMALAAMISGGTSKAARRNKENIDKISATIILQSYLEAESYKK